LGKTGTTIAKREKEKARQQKQAEKDVRKAVARERKAKGRDNDTIDGEDPDLAGIVLGPQPLPPELQDLPGER